MAMITPAAAHFFRTFRLGLGLMLALAGAGLKGQTVLSGTYTGPSTLSGNYLINSSATATFNSGYTFQATTNLTLGNYSTLNWNQNATLAGTAITSGTTAGYYATINIGTGNTLTFDAATTYAGYLNLSGYSSSTFNNYGLITQTSGTGTLYAPTFNNYGTITTTAGTGLYIGDYSNAGATNRSGGVMTVTGAGANLYLRNVANLGTLNAQSGGALQFQGSGNSTANFGSVVLSGGGRALIGGGTFTNTLLNAPTGGVYELYGGTINGGTIAAGALTFTNSGGMVTGATLLDPTLVVPASTYVTLSNDTLSGNITLGNNSTLTLTAGTFFPGTTLALGDYANLNWNQTGTLTNKTITSGVTAGYYAPIYIGGGYSLTLDALTTYTGDLYLNGYSGSTFTNYGLITQTSGTGTLYAPTFNNYGTITTTAGTGLYIGDYYSSGATNEVGGVITANGTGTNVYLRNVANLGTLNAQSGGALQFQGSGNSTANFGNVVLSGGGRALIGGGTFSNTLLTAPTGGVYELYGGTINGGVIAAGALTFTNSGGTIAGATLLASPLILPASTSVTLSNVTLTGNVTLGYNSTLSLTAGTFFPGTTLALGDYANLNWNQNGTLVGKTITSGVTAGYYAPVYIGSGYTLTLDSATTYTGDIYLNGGGGSTFTNYGLITQTSGTGTLYAPTFNNYGTITTTAGTGLYIGDYYSSGATNEVGGVITANGTGTNVYLRNVQNLGTLTAQSGGILQFQGNGNSTANFGTVVLSSGGRALISSGTFSNTLLTAPTGGLYELYGATINGGTIAAGALTFTSSGGAITGATLLDSTLILPASTSVTLSNDTLSGNITLGYNSTLTLTAGTLFPGTTLAMGDYANLNWNQNGTLVGKTITSGITTGYYAPIYIGGGYSLTLDSATTYTGDLYLNGYSGSTFTNYGLITQTSGTGTLYAPTFNSYGTITTTAGTGLYIGDYNNLGATNQVGGVITASGVGTNIYLRDVLNLGTLNAQTSGILQFQGNGNSTSNFGTVVLSGGGRALIAGGTFSNTLLNAPTGGVFELYGGTINGGTIAAGALTFTNNGGTIAGATLLASPLILPASTYVTLSNDTLSGNVTLGYNSSLTLTAGTFFPGTTLALGDYASLNWNQNGTLVGKTITSGVTAGYYAPIYIGGGYSLTLDSATTYTGDIYLNGNSGSTFNNYGLITQTSGTGTLYAPTLNNYGTITTTANTGLYIGDYYNPGATNRSGGTITANGSGTVVHLRNVLNQGSLTAQNGGALEFEGNNLTTAILGNVTLSTGGRALLNGIFDNTAASLNAIVGGSYELYGGTLTNGTVAAGALAFTSSGGTLNNVSFLGDLDFSSSSSYAYLTGGTSFSGANAVLGNYAGIYWQQVGTLTGKNLSLGTGAYLYVSGANNALTLGPGTTLTGTANVYSDGNLGTAITNQGTINQNISSGGSLYARNFTNAGTINITAGYVYLGYNSAGYNFSNTAAGSIVINNPSSYAYLQSPLNNAGIVNVQSGTLYAGTNLTNGSTGLIEGSGTINGNLVMAGGTLAPGNSVGTLTFQSSTFSVTNPSVFAIEISGATSDRAVFQSPTTNVNIGSGLLTLSLSLLSAPTPSTTFTIMSITSSSNVFAGSFAGLPNTGDSLVATFSTQSYVFSVNYLPNAITLNFIPVPEPGTYVLLGAGLAVLGLGYRRRRR